MRSSITAFVAAMLLAASSLHAGIGSAAVGETAELILKKFGRSTVGETVDQVAESAAKAVAKHGDDCLPLLRQTGPAGFQALETAGVQAPEVIKLYGRRGDEAVWLISQPNKLALFLKHGDNAADALLKYPGIADTLIGRYGDDAAGALTKLGRSQTQQLSILAANGSLDKLGRSQEILRVIREYGDQAMDFIWRNKGALTVASALSSFLGNPELYIERGKELIIDPIVSPIGRQTNWTLIAVAALGIVFLPYVARNFAKVRASWKSAQNPPAS